MSTPSQIQYTSQNATGPKSEAGKQTSSQNALQHGLTVAGDFNPTSEREEFIAFTTAYHACLNPIGIAEESCALKVRSAAWRLRRCRALEATLPEDPETHEKNVKSIERARAHAHNITRKAMLELRRGPVLVPNPRPIPRGGLCPCKSGAKYKRCCGRNVPSVRHKRAKKAA